MYNQALAGNNVVNGRLPAIYYRLIGVGSWQDLLALVVEFMYILVLPYLLTGMGFPQEEIVQYTIANSIFGNHVGSYGR